MADNEKAHPAQDRAGLEPATAKPQVQDRDYADIVESGCVVCGRFGVNLSVPFRRCLACIKAASAAWEAHLAALPPPTCRRQHVGRARVELPHTSPSDEPVFYRDFFPPAVVPAPLPQVYRDFFPEVSAIPARRYASPGSPRARLRGLLTVVGDARKGARNGTLHWAACRLGEMVAAGDFTDTHAAIDALRTVALGTGLTPSEVAGTIRSGLGASGVSS